MNLHELEVSESSSYSSEEESESATLEFSGIIQPYQFEPEASSSGDDNQSLHSDDDTEDNSRLNNLDW